MIIKKRTESEHDQSGLYNFQDAFCTSYGLYLEIYEAVCWEIGKRIKRISREGLAMAIQKVESKLNPNLHKLRVIAKKAGIDDDLVEFFIKQGVKGREIEIIEPIAVKFSIARIQKENRLIEVILLFPLAGRADIIDLVLQNIGFSENVLNTGSLRLSVNINKEIEESKIFTDSKGGTKKYFSLKK